MDLISRQAVIDAIERTDWYHINNNGELVHGANSKYDVPLYKADDIYKVINGLPSAQQWIPVSERLPDNEDEKVLVTDEYGDIDIAWFEFNEWMEDPKIEWWNGEYKVQPAAWMPLPEPYKGGQ